MNYFTPEAFYLRGQSTDAAVLNEVEQSWDDALDRYADHLRQLRPDLPPSVIELLDHFALSGADVLSMGQRANDLVIVLQPDPATATLLLTYTLTTPPRIQESVLPPAHQSERVAWMYDEVDRVGANGPWRHSILLSNGWEAQLHFSALQVVALEPLLLSGAARRRLAEAQRMLASHDVSAS